MTKFKRAIPLTLFLSFFSSFLCAEVEISTVTGDSIRYNNTDQTITVEGNAVAVNSTATIKGDKLTIDVNNKVGYGQGNVEILTGSGTLTGSSATYYWEASTGVIVNATGESPPWKFQGDKLISKNLDVYDMRKVRMTSCDHDPPHYAIVSTRGRIKMKKRISMQNARLHVGILPSLWTPFFSRSLEPRKLRIRVEPGHTSRDGIITKTLIGYPLNVYSYGTIKWDWLQRTGNGIGFKYDYYHPDIRGVLDTFYIRDHNEDPQPQERRSTVLWNHFQRITERLTANARVDFKSDQTFGNQFSDEGNGVRVENTIRGLLSEGGFSYRFNRATVETEFLRRDRFDSEISSDSFISELVLPRMKFNTTKLQFKPLPFYTQFTGDWTNQTRVRNDPDNNLKYVRNANGSVRLDRDIQIRKARMTITPQVTYQQSWNSDISTFSTRDVYQARYNYGLNWRQRMGRYVDSNVRYTQSFRSKQDKFERDADANDRGIESDKISGSLTGRWLRSNRVTFTSGVDLRAAPRGNSEKFRHSSARFDPPSMDLQIQVRPNVTVFYREAYSIFNTSTQRPQRTPLNTSGEIQFGQISKLTYFSQGFNYTKSGSGDPAQLNLTNRLKFFLTPKWYINLYLSYRAIGENKLKYSKFKPIDKSLTLVRDMHCWIFRMEFSDRGDRREASFFIDLKANLTSPKNIFKSASDSGYYPYREHDTDVEKIFPFEEQHKEHIIKEND